MWGRTPTAFWLLSCLPRRTSLQFLHASAQTLKFTPDCPPHLFIVVSAEHRLSAHRLGACWIHLFRVVAPIRKMKPNLLSLVSRTPAPVPAVSAGTCRKNHWKIKFGRRLLSWTPSLLPMVERIALAGAHDVTVLLTGETGTGKTHPLKLILRLLAAQSWTRFLVVLWWSIGGQSGRRIQPRQSLHR